MTHFIKIKANNHHPTIKFAEELSENSISFLDTIVYIANQNFSIYNIYLFVIARAAGKTFKISCFHSHLSVFDRTGIR